MNTQEEYPDFFGDTPIYSIECFKKDIKMRDNSYIEVTVFEIVDAVSEEIKVL